MTTLHRVAIMGASGVLGSAIFKVLKAKDFDITVLSRPESKATFPEGTKIVKIPYNLFSLKQAFANQEVVICATHSSSISDQKTYIDACIAANVHRYITNDFGNALDFKGLPELEFTRRPKLDILAYVQHQASEHRSFTWTALATGHFLDYAIIKFPAFGFDVTSKSARLVDGGEEPFSATTLADVGRAIAGILVHPAETSNKYLLVRSLETSQREILAALEAQTRTKWTIEQVTAKELHENGKVKLAQGDRGAILTLLPAQIFEKGAGRYAFPKTQYDNNLLDVEEQTVEQVVREVLAQVEGVSL